MEERPMCCSQQNGTGGGDRPSRTYRSLPERLAKKRQLIPPQALVPFSMKPEEGSSSSTINGYDAMIILDERVHGGGLMSLLGGNLKKTIDGI
ncbi:hypothetical protein SAY87_027472 [Trapa incisa]|uniref:Uncharacterized protein n=1 Tax=Trapa incisa TaxID=236973 RepID=A0AAN7JMI9_9MYRT|nr:hypothetical protein SAY87_027472 [Trapa incisa]